MVGIAHSGQPATKGFIVLRQCLDQASALTATQLANSLNQVMESGKMRERGGEWGKWGCKKWGGGSSANQDGSTPPPLCNRYGKVPN